MANTRKEYLFKVYVGTNRESYFFYLIENHLWENDIPLSLFEDAIVEANRFIDFYYIDNKVIPYRLKNANRHCTAENKASIRKFDIKDAPILKKDLLIKTGAFTLEYLI
ncbi:hypothetical protein DFO73_103439 [Cytobacillus oceanisediminis]|uniref:Uncharacterized protein n=1 Tax=Cytobacillus oceanisediminis TaxID=665099 RepID=A0A2V3A169_9BACI|nr:hypothetical protein [Cytobacillus oceanisediminis]PWW30546.1 hypothetical protein DFO73_103439 [Cytobacillus oceanisediminis]